MIEHPKVLLVDDEVDFVVPLKDGLEAQGYIVFTAGDGLAALEIAKKELPNLILLDLVLPKLDGHQVLKRLKLDEQCRQVPVLVITAQEEVQKLAPTLEEGADSYYVKPLKFDILLTLIRTLLNSGR